ncbi:MAG: tetratricopeptide repeat protein [Bacteroides sp.]|nr:tetratricopeptide repeat protein [Bacteroides sp.]
MLKKRYITFVAFVLIALTSVFAQKAERDYIRKGNKAYKDSIFVDAEINYRKALDVNPQSTASMYNLGNTLANQQKFQDAMKQYEAASKIEKDKSKLAQIYHNAGVLFHAAQDYAKAIEAYKMSLRNNPNDDETRYNLALAQKMLQEQEQQQDQQNQDEQNEQQQEQQEQEQQQDQQNQDEQNEEDQQQQQENEMSKENAEQMLNALMQDEKDVQEKVQKQQAVSGGRLEKDW